jgi:choline dehydrogenase
MSTQPSPEFDFIVVGSGAGGGPLAARLARAGMVVLLLEAGGDSENYHYQVPCFHGQAAEDEEYSWDFFVRHYADDERQHRDTKFDPARDGVFYPRAGTLGGCTAHNAMITVYPHNRDWDHIAELTGDQSWRHERMRPYFERLERNRYRRRPWAYPRNRLLARLIRSTPLLSRLFGNHSRHGYDGWLTTQQADPLLVFRDWKLVDVLVAAGREALESDLGRSLDAVEDLLLGEPKAYLDPNDWEAQAAGRDGQGIWLTPLATNDGKRNGTREFIKETQKRYPDNLIVRTGCLATRVLFNGTRAIGVEYLEAPHLYKADPRAAADGQGEDAPVRQAFCRREVVLSGGAFNTPQLLKLSGVGPREELDRFGIDVVVDRAGVGEGLQDRYEVGIVNEMTGNFKLLDGATFEAPAAGEVPDAFFEEWTQGKGVYCTNGALLGIVKKSKPERPLPDLFVFGLPARFKGYYRGYSKALSQHKDIFTWAVLKAHTENSAGWVRLRSADPRDVPEINFRYFEEGNDAAGEDLESVVEGVLFARELMSRAAAQVKQELVPGPTVQTREEIRDFVRREAWGHHASCTCRMGPASDPMAVVDSAFRVHGTQGLRVVDASVFPRIPGFFIVTAVYMLSEKAADAILADVPPATKTARKVKAVAASAAAAAHIRKLERQTP